MPRGKKSPTLGFARGFVLPTAAESKKAAGTKPAEWSQDKWSAFFTPFYPVPSPTSVDDWLAQYNEPGQTLEEFREENPWIVSRRGAGYQGDFFKRETTVVGRYPEGKMYLAVLSKNEERENVAPSVETLRRFASVYHQLPVEVLTGLEAEETKDEVFLKLPEDDQRRASKRLRRRPTLKHRRRGNKIQLHCPGLLRHLKSLLPSDALALIVLTDYDLYEGAKDLFVAGLASPFERVAVFSFARYDPALDFSTEFWHDISKSEISMGSKERKRLVLARCCKLLVHEMGHLVGLDHCVHYQCCMNGSGHLEEDFRQPIFLCPVCLRKQQWIAPHDCVTRYEKMLEFFTECDLAEEAAWLKKRIQALKC